MTPYSFNPMGHDVVAAEPTPWVFTPVAIHWYEASPGVAPIESASGTALADLTMEDGNNYLECRTDIEEGSGPPPAGTSRGTLTRCSVLTGGRMIIGVAGYAQDAEANNHGIIQVKGNAAEVNRFVLLGGGTMTMENGYAHDGTIGDSSGFSPDVVFVSGGTLADTIVYSGGTVFDAGGFVADTVVVSGGTIIPM